MAGGVWGATWGGDRPCGSQLWQALGCFSLHSMLWGTGFQSPLGSPLWPSPSLSCPLFTLSMSVAGPGQQLSQEMKTFRKWHVPEAEALAGRPGGSGALLSIPKYPKYVPSLAAKPQQCLPSSPPPSDPGSARRSACRKVPERHRCQGRPRPGL